MFVALLTAQSSLASQAAEYQHTKIEPMKQENLSSTKLDWLQALRGIAAFAVMLCHVRYYFRETDFAEISERMFFPGAMGVDLFFIISGFIMVYTTVNSKCSSHDIYAFAVKRVARIWPPYIAACLLYASFDQILTNSVTYVPLIKSLLFQPISFDSPPYFGAFHPNGWTLVFEVYFYLIFGLSMIFGRWRWTTLITWILLSVVVFPWFAGSFQFNVFAVPVNNPNYFAIVTNPLVLEFLVGVVIALIAVHGVSISSPLISWGLIGLAAAYSTKAFFATNQGTHGIQDWGYPLALLVLAIAIRTPSIQLRPTKVLLWLGEISYSLYLTHLLTFTYLERHLQPKLQHNLAGVITFSIISILLSIVFAVIFHRILEVWFSDLFRAALYRLERVYLQLRKRR